MSGDPESALVIFLEESDLEVVWGCKGSWGGSGGEGVFDVMEAVGAGGDPERTVLALADGPDVEEVFGGRAGDKAEFGIGGVTEEALALRPDPEAAVAVLLHGEDSGFREGFGSRDGVEGAFLEGLQVPLFGGHPEAPGLALGDGPDVGCGESVHDPEEAGWWGAQLVEAAVLDAEPKGFTRAFEDHGDGVFEPFGGLVCGEDLSVGDGEEAAEGGSCPEDSV